MFDVYAEHLVAEDFGSFLGDRVTSFQLFAGVAAAADEGEADGADPTVEALASGPRFGVLVAGRDTSCEGEGACVVEYFSPLWTRNP